jgi:exodeoxyribonuclease-3
MPSAGGMRTTAPTMPALGETALAAAIYKDERFSDHAPLTLDYDYEF